jgi:hypothetical protein
VNFAIALREELAADRIQPNPSDLTITAKIP